MAGITLRPAEVGDARAIARIHVLAWQTAYRGILPAQLLRRQSVERREKEWADCLAHPRDGQRLSIDVALVDEQVAGFCLVGLSRDEDADASVGEVQALYVDPARWGHGAGTALLSRGEQRLGPEFGCRQATLWVLEDNVGVRSWYEGRGWSWDGQRREERRGSALLRERRYRKRRLPRG